MSRKIVIGISGASGAVYAKLLFEKLLQIKHQWNDVAVVMSNNAKTVWQSELQDKAYEQLPFRFYDKSDFFAPFASGSAKYDTMMIVPCSMGTLARIAAGVSDDLLTRAADVILKERRRLILGIRDTPYNLIHIKNMEAVTLVGGIICPLSPSFYSMPKTIEEAASTVVDRMLDLCGFERNTYRWGDDEEQ